MYYKYLEDIEKCIEYLEKGYTIPAETKLKGIRDSIKEELNKEDEYQNAEEKKAWGNQDASCGIIGNNFLNNIPSENPDASWIDEVRTQDGD